MSIEQEAAQVRDLMNDPAWKAAIQRVTDNQIAVFRNSNSSQDDRERAHNIICALDEIASELVSVLTNEKVAQARNK